LTVDNSDVEQIHRSVLLDETIGYLAPYSGGIYVDGTLGLGGHSQAILKSSEPDGKVIAFEWDGEAISLAEIRLQQYAHRLTIIRNNFSEIISGLGSLGVVAVDGVLVDVGMSSLQLDGGGRGFSFRRDEALDMRMDNRRETTAALIVNKCSEEELADIFFHYGDERQARPIAREIVKERRKNKITTSRQLANVVAASVPKRFHPKKIHVATKVFQALRIAVNTELENLATLLDDVVSVLKPGGRICVISFHSLEDRLVKRKFKANKELEVITSRPVVPMEEEVYANPRARSARLRVAEKKK